MGAPTGCGRGSAGRGRHATQTGTAPALHWRCVASPAGLAVGVTQVLVCFYSFITFEFYDELLVQTNLYADENRDVQNNTSTWNPVSKEELMAFVGIYIVMGLISQQ